MTPDATQVSVVHDGPDPVVGAPVPGHGVHHALGAVGLRGDRRNIFAMFVNDRFFATELQKHVDDNYLFKRHVTLLICDGAAIAHHTGTSGHAVRCSVCACAVVCAVRCARLMCVLCAVCAGDTRL